MTDELSDRELLAEEMIARLLESIGAGDQHLTVGLVNGHAVGDLPIVVVMLAGMLHRQESSNELLVKLARQDAEGWRAQKVRADRAERQVQELRIANADQASTIGRLREARAA